MRTHTLPLILIIAAVASCNSSTAVPSNLSFFGMMTADSYKHEKNMPFMAGDGEVDNYSWEPEAGKANAWLQLSFPNRTQADSATIYWDTKTPEGCSYCLEYSNDGKTWGEVPGASYSRENATTGGLETLKDAVHFKPVKARMYRISITAAENSTCSAGIREFELSGDIRQFDTLKSVRGMLSGNNSKPEGLKLVNNASDPWHLDLPRPAAGIIADGVYYSAPGVENDADCSTELCSQMQIVSDCSVQDFKVYLDELTKAGYGLVAQTELEKNCFAELQGNGKDVYVYYTDSERYIRIICDGTPTTQESFSYSACTNGETGIYQFALNYSDNTHDTMDCGMLYALLLGDGSVMMVDGSHIFQTSEEFYRGVYDFLRDITGTPAGEKVRIACWYITHSHSDHLAGASGFLRRYHDKVDLQRVMFNFPASAVKPASTAYASQFRHTLRTYFPDVTFIKPHTGMHLNLAMTGIDVMYTHEDAINAERPSAYPLRDFNCTSTILKVTMGGCSAVLFGDTNVEAERIITRNYTPVSWQADLVQVAHHCFNYLTTLYEWCHAPVVMIPNSQENAHTEHNDPRTQDALQYAKDGAYYEGDDTYGVRPTENGFVLCYQKPRVGKLGYEGTAN